MVQKLQNFMKTQQTIYIIYLSNFYIRLIILMVKIINKNEKYFKTNVT